MDCCRACISISIHIYTYIRDHLGIDGVDVWCFLYIQKFDGLLTCIAHIYIHIHIYMQLMPKL